MNFFSTFSAITLMVVVVVVAGFVLPFGRSLPLDEEPKLASKRLLEKNNALKQYLYDNYNDDDDVSRTVYGWWDENINDAEKNRIIGGTDAAINDAPFQAQLFRRYYFSNRFLCGGSLITSRTVLTAGHCVSKFFNYRIRYGSNSRYHSPYGDAEVAKMILHPKFNLATVQNDIALFILKKPIQMGANVRTIDLERNGTVTGSNVTLYGFGLMHGNDQQPAGKLQKTTLTVLDDKECEKFVQKMRIKKNPGMFCASAPDRSACNGDSGGPLVTTSTGNQIGIVSFGTRQCPPGSINVYTNVSYYMDWINENKVD